MKRCPQCNRVENDDALVFCRVDGTALVSDSSSLDNEARTAQLGSASAATEVETSILPHATDATMSRGTAPTTVLPAQQPPSTTRELTKPKRDRVAIAIVLLIALAIAIGGCFYLARKRKGADPTTALMPVRQ